MQSDAMAVVAGLAARFTQETRLLRLTTPLGPDVLLAEAVRAEEGLSQGFLLRVEALSLRADIALKALIGQPALLELQTATGTPRPFHGIITAAEATGANGGMARYVLQIAPWTAFLGLGRDSRIFQDVTVLDIIDAVCRAYQGKGRLNPALRFDILDESAYPKRSLVTQYQESDWAFLSRLMQEEGLFYYFDHTGDAGSTTLGAHTLVVADHNGAFAPAAQRIVRFTQPGFTMPEDTMDRWRTEARAGTNGVTLRSWDYRTLGTRPVAASSPGSVDLVAADVPGAYAYADRAHGQHIADRQAEALHARQEVHVGAGTVRTIGAGTQFTLEGHGRLHRNDSAADFVAVRVVHLMHNNLEAPLQSAVRQVLGEGALRAALGSELAGSLHAVGSTVAERPLYRNRVDAIPASRPYRSPLTLPRPTVRGQQSAIVVGPPGVPVHTDRDHRVKVQFHWQRGSDSHSRLAHPDMAGDSGAPADDTAGTWVRVATPLAPVAGANWGGHALPRVGQEVLVDFIEGDIDRPVVIGALYNGRGGMDAQHNEVSHGAGTATGNAGPWFPGEAGRHAHAAVLSGLKSQALADSQQGVGGYNQLVFDDTPGEARTLLQQCASAHDGGAELGLGHLRHQVDNQRLSPAGFGAELRAAGGVAVRAAEGLLVTAHPGTGQLDARDAQTQVGDSHTLAASLADTARQHNAALATTGAATDEPPALAALRHSAQVLDASDTGSDQDGTSGGMGRATAFSEPHLQVTSPAGIVATTPASAVVTARGTTAIGAGQDIDHAAQANGAFLAAKGMSLFAYGKAQDPDKPNQETGIRLHAASGKASVQSQAGTAAFVADKAVTVASTAKSVTAAAKDHVMLTAQGAYLKLEGGNIMIHGPGKMTFKASQKELAGPANASFALPTLPNGELDLRQDVWHTYAAQYQVLAEEERIAGQPYLLKLPDGSLHYGETDEKGKTIKVGTSAPQPVELTLLHKESWDQENVNVWHHEMDKHWD